MNYKKGNLSFNSFDGKKINCLKLEPELTKLKESSVPGVLFHPGNRCTPDDYMWLLEPLVNAGYLVLGVYQRGYGSGEPGINDRGGQIQQKDFELALNYLKSIPEVDQTRIALIGHSNGGHMVQRIAAKERVKCVVALSQICDWSLFISSCKDYLPDYYQQVINEFGGPPETNPEPYRERSCLHLASDTKVPVLAIVGGDDTTTPIHLTKLMYEALRKSGNDKAEMVVIPNVGHFYEEYSFSGYKTSEVSEKVINWLKANL